MKKSEIVSLYRYNAWANARIWNAAARLTTEQFLAPAPFSDGGLRAILVHLLFAEWLWRQRWEGKSPAAWFLPEDFPTLESLRSHWHEEESALLAFAENVKEEALDQTIHYTTTGGRPYENVLWQLMLHLINHGTQHRSEAATLLTGYGQSPGDLDLILYLRQTNK